MCFQAPGKVIKIADGKATVDYGSFTREADASLVLPEIGDYAIVNAGFVVEVLEKKRTDEFLEMVRS